MKNDNNCFSAAQKSFVAGFDVSGDTLPKVLVEKMLKTNIYLATQSAQKREREENVCRLFASGMIIEDISLILRIRIEEVRIIESNNAKTKIPEYTRTFKARAKRQRGK